MAGEDFLKFKITLDWRDDDDDDNDIRKLLIQVKVARWQNLIPSFPWIAPGWRAWGAIQGQEGIKFCRAA